MTLPVVSGVGHETDFTITDFVADVRAPTPTGAATLVTPDRREVLAGIEAFASRFRRAALRALETRIQRVDGLARRLVHPAARLAQQRRDTHGLAGRLARAGRSHLQDARQRVDGAQSRVAWRLRQPLPPVRARALLADAMRRAAATRVERTGRASPPSRKTSAT